MAPDEHDAVRDAVARLGGITSGDTAIDVGGRDINGTVRDLFEGAEYLAVDQKAGPNVDKVANGNALPFEDNSFKWVVCNSMMEHDPFFWLTLDELYRVCNKYLIIGTPTYGFHYHADPGDGYLDYWRFSEDAYTEVLMAGCENVHVALVNRCGDPRLLGSGILKVGV